MREKDLEQKFVREIRRIGGLCPKFVSPGMSGMPDRLILLPDGKASFAELKRPKAKPRALQRARHRKLRSLGFKVYLVDSEEAIAEALDDLQAT